MDKAQRRKLRADLKWALRPVNPWNNQQGQKVMAVYTVIPGRRLKEWFCRKLTFCAAYGIVDKSRLPERDLKLTHLHYVERVPIKQLALEFRIPEKVVARNIGGVLDYIIAHAPESILKSLCP
jgi:hypothetical protein